MSSSQLSRIALIGSIVVFCASAEAQLFRSYLKSTGNDSNPCTLQAPCRLLPAALSAVASGGEVWMLDSANYNVAPVTVDKSVSILAVPGVVGSLVATGGPAISIPGAGLSVALRNLVIAPVVTLPAGTSGVTMTGASQLTIENSLIANLLQAGVEVEGSGTVKIVNSTLRNIGGFAVSLSEGARGSITSTQLLDLGSGSTGGAVRASSSTPNKTTATLSDCVIAGSPTGVWASSSAAAGVARISVTRSSIQKTNIALHSHAIGSGATEVNFGSSLIADNNFAWSQEGAGSTVLSLGNNQLRGNGSSIGTKTSLTPQ